MRESCISLVFLFSCSIFGVIFTAISAPDMVDYYQSQRWESTSGEILSSEVQISQDSEDGDTYRAYVRYEYVVNDTLFEGDRLSFDGQMYSSDADAAYEKVNSFEPGQEITVYYDPDDPDDSVLERELSTTLIVFFVIGIIVCIGGVAIVLGLAFHTLRQKTIRGNREGPIGGSTH